MLVIPARSGISVIAWVPANVWSGIAWRYVAPANAASIVELPLNTTLSCVQATPFGNPVVPDV